MNAAQLALLRRAVLAALALSAAPASAQDTEQAKSPAAPSRPSSSPRRSANRICRTCRSSSPRSPSSCCRTPASRTSRTSRSSRPGLIVTSTSNEACTTARIRGIGTVGDNPGLESSVGVVIDGVYRPRNGVGFGDLGELERIEVLKGPQGTLFGKNTSAGVINVVTKKPTLRLRLARSSSRRATTARWKARRRSPVRLRRHGGRSPLRRPRASATAISM